MPDVGELAAAFHTHYVLSGGDRCDRLAAADWAWAWEALREAAEQPDEALGGLVDALLDLDDPHPAAYRAYLGAGVLEDSLGTGSATWGLTIAARCRSSAAWREAVAGVALDDRMLPMLSTYLPQARWVPFPVAWPPARRVVATPPPGQRR